MLGKLIKHEWKSVSKVGGSLLLAVMVVTILGCIFLQVSSFGELMASDNIEGMQAVALVFMGVASMIVYIMMLVGVSYGIFIYLGVRFYKTMYTDEGYLIHTLPVTPNQILISKVLVGGVWYFLITVSMSVSIFSLIFSLISGLFQETLAMEGYTIWEFIRMMGESMTIVYEEMGFSMVRYAVTMLILFIVGPFASLMTLFGALTVGQLSRKYKALMGILVYFGLMIVNMIINMIVQMVVTIGQIGTSMVTNTVNMNATYDASTIVSIVVGVLMYVFSYLIISKKLNLE